MHKIGLMGFLYRIFQSFEKVYLKKKKKSFEKMEIIILILF